jgi:hypothetical protein
MPKGSDREAHEVQSSEQLRDRAARVRLAARLVSDNDVEKALADSANELDARAEAIDREAGRD